MLELLLLLLLLLEHDHVSMMLLLLLYCGRLLRILDGPAPVTELEADLLRHLDRHRAATSSRIVLCQVGSFRSDLVWREARQIGLDCGMRLVHLQRRHRDVVLVLLTDLEGLLQNVFVADDAHIWILRLGLMIDNLLGLVNGHLLDHIG